MFACPIIVAEASQRDHMITCCYLLHGLHVVTDLRKCGVFKVGIAWLGCPDVLAVIHGVNGGERRVRCPGSMHSRWL